MNVQSQAVMSAKSANEWYTSTPSTLTQMLADAFEIARRVVFFTDIHALTHTRRRLPNRPTTGIL
jgi:hypothetical protein